MFEEVSTILSTVAHAGSPRRRFSLSREWILLSHQMGYMPCERWECPGSQHQGNKLGELLSVPGAVLPAHVSVHPLHSLEMVSSLRMVSLTVSEKEVQQKQQNRGPL